MNQNNQQPGSAELLPCPFCGGQPRISKDSGDERNAIKATRAAVSAATKPTADLSKLIRYEWTRDGMDNSMDEPARWTEPTWVKLADVQSLLATKPAAQAVPEELRSETIVVALKERRATIAGLLGNTDWAKDTLNGMIARLDAAIEIITTPAAPLSADAAQEQAPADEMDADEALEAVARAIWEIRREHEDRCDMELEDVGDDHEVWDEAEAAIRALKRPASGTEGAA